MAGVSAVRAALVTDAFSRRIADDAVAPGEEATIVTALTTAGAADAFLTRVAPLAKVGLRRWRLTAFESALTFELGQTLTLTGDELAPLDGEDLVVVGVEDDIQADATILTLRGPEPAEEA